MGLPWEVASFYSEQVPEREDEEDEDEEEMNYATLQRLKNADERTKNMTKDEYVHWSDCRQASFTFRKGKRFKEWAGFGVVTDSKPNDDIVDILGFLTFEIVQTLTEEALKVKEAEDMWKTKNGGESQTKKRKRESGLFDPPEEGRTPIEPKHVQEAFRRLQHRSNKGRAMRNFSGRALHRTPLKLVCQQLRTLISRADMPRSKPHDGLLLHAEYPLYDVTIGYGECGMGWYSGWIEPGHSIEVAPSCTFKDIQMMKIICYNEIARTL